MRGPRKFKKVVTVLSRIAIPTMKAVKRSIMLAPAINVKTASNHQNTMKTLALIISAISFLSCVNPSLAGDVRGYTRKDGTYVQPHYRASSGSSAGVNHYYRNPNAAAPVVHVQAYVKSDDTKVTEHYRTPPNATITDNLSYRGFGTIRK